MRDDENMDCFDVVDENLMRMIDGLQSADEQRQTEAADQLAAVLLMANEDTLPPHLPVRLGISSKLKTGFLVTKLAKSSIFACLFFFYLTVDDDTKS